MLTAQQLVDHYQLLPHPEGGFYKETYRCSSIIETANLPAKFVGKRSISTGIYFLLAGKQFSAFHKIKSDEMWHFYAGGALLIYVIDAAANLTTIKLGNNLANGETFQAIVPAGCWFASAPADENSFCFVGCTVAPGFDFDDFELAKYSELAHQYPQHAQWLAKLCIR